MWPWLEVMSLKSLGMEVFRANIREREKFLDRVEKDGEIEGE